MKITIVVDAMLNGKNCVNPKVEFIQGADMFYPCEIKGNSLTFELRPGVDPNVCIEGFIKCDDECLNCPPQYFKKCLCNDVTTLEECQICVDGFIENTCTPDEQAAGKICTPDGCKCPPNKPITDPTTGQCVQCITGDRKDCKVCIAGVWEEVSCGVNERCENGVCSCLPGYVKDPYTNECVAPPKCVDGDDCPECYSCVLGNCEPMICPDGFKCYKGKCVEWPCTNETCGNGADCGKGCGCVEFEGKRQCVPCAILECEGLCEQALGCECNNGKCEGVDKCSGYCDNNTPCSGANCTCYNNECVDCRNFPCDGKAGGCASYVNCSCKDDGKCGGDGGDGGDGCSDTLTIKKECGKTPNSCKLVGTYKTDSNCRCDDIRVETTATGAPGTISNNIDLSILPKLYKGSVEYSDFGNINIGDNEFVEGTISTTITHYTKDGKIGTETVFTPSDKGINTNNKIDSIRIQEGINFKTKYTDSSGKEQGYRVVIELRAKGVTIPNNGCVDYNKSIVIARYELDYTGTGSVIETKRALNYNKYTVPVKAAPVYLNDLTSIRVPLFIWSKTTTDFPNTPYVNNGSYNSKGWFRKEYGTMTGAGWISTIDSPSKGLVNNYDYQLKVDCGCGSGSTMLPKVIFCCNDTIEYTLSKCGTELTIEPFNTCDVNGILTNTSSVPTAKESQTYYYVKVNGKDTVLNSNGGGPASRFTITSDDVITTIEFSQRYIGAPMIPIACVKEFTETPDPLDFDVITDCGEIIIKRSGPAITNVTVDGSNATSTQNNSIWTKTVDKLTKTYKVKVTFSGGCSRSKDIEVICDGVVEAIPTSIYATGECPNGPKPDVKVQTLSGFTGAAEFLDPRPPMGRWFPAESFVGNKAVKTFKGFDAGTYTFSVREAGKADAQVTIEIKSPINPNIEAIDICGSTNGSIKISGGAPGSKWRIAGKAYSNLEVTLDTNGNATVTIPVSGDGNYAVQLIKDDSGATCPTLKAIVVNKIGGTVTPTIVKNVTEACQGSDVEFGIKDGGLNLTYDVQCTGGIITDMAGNPISQLKAAGGIYNAKANVTQQGAVMITVSRAEADCYKTIDASTMVTVKPGPMLIIGSINIECSQTQPGNYDVFVPVRGTVTGVTIARKPASEVLPRDGDVSIWTISNMHLLRTDFTITATNSANGCTSSVQWTEPLPNCDDFSQCPQPPQTVNIAATPEGVTCGPDTVDIDFQYSTLGDLTGQQYAWYSVTGGGTETLVNTSFPNPGIISGPIPTLTVGSNPTSKDYKLRIKTKGVCTFDSNIVTVVSGAAISPDINGPTNNIYTTGVYYYYTQTIPGATYEWLLSNINGSNQPIGTNSPNVEVSTFAEGNNALTVNITSANCSGSATLNVVATLNCNKRVAIQPSSGMGDASCKDLSGFDIENPNGSPTISYKWFVDGIMVDSGAGTVADLDMSGLGLGDTKVVTLEMTFADGCVVTSDDYNYSRCGCLCDSNGVCGGVVTETGNSGQILTVTVPAGMTDDLYVWFKIGGWPDRMTIIRNSDSTEVLRTIHSGTPSNITKLKEGGVVYKHLHLAAPSVPVGASIIGLSGQVVYATTDCNDNTIGGSYPATALAGVVAQRSADYGGNVGIYAKIPFSVHLGSDLDIVLTPFNVERCDGASDNTSNQCQVATSCSPIPGAGTI